MDNQQFYGTGAYFSRSASGIDSPMCVPCQQENACDDNMAQLANMSEDQIAQDSANLSDGNMIVQETTATSNPDDVNNVWLGIALAAAAYSATPFIVKKSKETYQTIKGGWHKWNTWEKGLAIFLASSLVVPYSIIGINWLVKRIEDRQ